MANVERALIAYAVLKSQLEQADLYEGLMVFFRPITSSLAGKRFIPGEFANELAMRYGLHVPALVVESLAERMANTGLAQLTLIRDMSRRCEVRLKVWVVQPGLSAVAASHSQLTLLAVTERYLTDTYQIPLQVICSL